ncbi:MAG TPA: sensor histidine kinase [Anaeromyxobacteraceae bacterium]|nr:sensor histidine kinase [Anaeromyxobacteraceae bacterium]
MRRDHESFRAAEILIARQDEIIARWEREVRAHVSAARRESRAVIVDTIPAFLRRLAEALSPRHPRSTAAEGTTIAQQHGSERVRVTGYGLSDVIREYQLLRDVLLQVLKDGGSCSDAVKAGVVTSIDAAVREACDAFVSAAHAVRERIIMTLAHDLRGPLSAARAGTSLILRRPEDASVPRWAARVDDNIDRMDKMIRTLLDVSRAGTGSRLTLELAPCDAVAVVRNVLDAQRLAHGDRFVLRSPEQVTGQWNCDALSRAVENLVSNAMKYGDPIRPVTVSVRRAHDRAILNVHNEGSVISPEDRETLFDMYRRAPSSDRSNVRGWGLGLALVKAVAEAHGGTVDVDSLAETGTTFTIDLPIDARPFQAQGSTRI